MSAETPGTAENPLHPEKLGPVLAEVLGDLAWADFHADLIAGGKSNLTYRLHAGGASVILRRPPTGKLLPKAHDMARECRILRALAGSGVPVPEVLHFEEADNDVLGVAYLVMEDVRGIVVRDVLPEDWTTPTAARAVTRSLVDGLVGLHAVDPLAVGLDGYGRPEGFFERQVTRWQKQVSLEASDEIPELTELGRRLLADVPPQQVSGIVHGDYRIDNCIFSGGPGPVLKSVLDWELSTLGDPLADLGMLLFYWREEGEEPWMLAPATTAHAAFPGRSEVLELYATGSSLDLSCIREYQALAHFKFAGITHGVAARVARGAMAGQDFGDLSGETRRLAIAGLDVLDS
jgi:aminoglycoside phosphotransferase (APT) family kinase protein